MKKCITLVLVVVMMMSLTACCTCDCDEQIAQLQQEVSALKAQLEERNQMVSVETIPEETATKETLSEEEYENLMVALNNQVNSGTYENLCAVAKCEYATEEHLMKLAEYTVKWNYSYLAKLIIDNPATTVDVLLKLTESPYGSVAIPAHEAIENGQ